MIFSEGLMPDTPVLFGDIYDWAGQFRVINIEKQEKLLGGRSVWYSNDENIAQDLQNAFDTINSKKWDAFSQQEFAHELAMTFPKSGRRIRSAKEIPEPSL